MYALAPQPEWIAWGTLPFFLNIPCKVIQQFWTLFYTMMWATPAAQWIIIQVISLVLFTDWFLKCKPQDCSQEI